MFNSVVITPPHNPYTFDTPKGFMLYALLQGRIVDSDMFNYKLGFGLGAELGVSALLENYDFPDGRAIFASGFGLTEGAMLQANYGVGIKISK